MSRKVRLTTPISAKEALALRVGDEVLISGVVITARDRAHRFLAEEANPRTLPFYLGGAIIYHCGPLVKREGEKYRVISAGPTTSARMNIYAPKVLDKFGVRGFIGKGGMNETVGRALKKYGAVYLAATGGAAVLLGKCITKVLGNFKLKEFGLPECFWILEVKDLPAIVAMDAHGGDLFRKVRERCAKVRNILLASTRV